MNLTEAPKKTKIGKGGYHRELTAKELGAGAGGAERLQRLKELAKKIKKVEADLMKLEAQRIALRVQHTGLKSEKEKITSGGESIFAYIEKHCQEFLQSARKAKTLLYRGMHVKTQKAFIGHPRADREPVDTSEETQAMVDNALSKAGFKALRGNSLFTSADLGVAEQYGKAFAIFPMDGFKFTWSTKYNDFYSDFISKLEDSADLNYSATIEQIDYEFSIIEDRTSERFYNTQNWNEENPGRKKPLPKKFLTPQWFAVIERGETPEQIDYYVERYAKNKTIMASPQFRKLYARMIKRKNIYSNIVKMAGFSQTNLVAALKSDHEIYILGDYVAIPEKLFPAAEAHFLESAPSRIKF
jgi:hypothetical protein